MEDVDLHLVERWRRGDQEAASALFGRYVERLLALARSRMPAGLGRRVDPEDVVQSVCRSFFVGARAGRYELRRGVDLWQLLVVMTLHKLRDQIKHHAAEKRSIAGERPFGSEDSLHLLQPGAFAEAPSPADAAALIDEVERLMRDLTATQRLMLEMRLQGHDLDEIATATGRCSLTVRRTLERIKENLSQGQALLRDGAHG